MITAHFVLDKRSKKGLKQIYFMPYYLKKYNRIPSGIYATMDTFSRYRNNNLQTADAKQLNYDLTMLSRRIEEVGEKCIQNGSFNIDQFKLLFKGKSDKLTLETGFALKTGTLSNKGTIGIYRMALNKFKELGLKNMDELTVEKINEYENILSEDMAWSTVGIRMKSLKAVYSHCIKKGLIANNPFKGYQMPTAQNTKKALTDKEIKFLLDYRSSDYYDQRAVDFWKICYMTFGRYPSDIKALKWSNIHRDYIVFHQRVKTKNMRNKKYFEVPLTGELLFLIEKYGVKGAKYVFEINDLHSFKRRINDRLKKICAGFSIKVTLQTARHSAATKLMRSGSDIRFIQNALGHSKITTTELYLGSFSDDYTKSMAGKLLE